jgi:hypothetical protein
MQLLFRDVHLFKFNLLNSNNEFEENILLKKCKINKFYFLIESFRSIIQSNFQNI